MDTILLVDFDGTIFNSDLFHKNIAEYLNIKYKLPLEDFYSSFEKAKEDGLPHNLKKQLKIVGFRNVNGLIKEIKQHLLSTNQNYIYEDVLDFINKYKKSIVIYTFADEKYYKYKQRISSLSKYRLPYIIVNSDKNTFLSTNINSLDKIANKKIIWVDDKVSVFKSTIKNVEFIRIKREGNKHSVYDTPKDITEINNLLELNIA